MSLAVWLGHGKKVNIGGRDFLLLPLPLKRLHEIGKWLEENCNEVVQEVLATARNKKEAADPFGMVTKVLLRVNANQIVYELLAAPKNPETGQPINDITKEFVDEYLDPISAQEFFKTFVSVNDLDNLIKNLRRLPMVEKLLEVASSTFGLPYLSSLLPSTASAQSKSEGSPSPKSTVMSMPGTSDTQEGGKTETSPAPQEEESKPPKKEMIQ